MIDSTVLGAEGFEMPGADHASYGIVAFSHLRWNFVWQRPQQFLSRFAADHPVLFVEEPIYDLEDGQEPTLELANAGGGVTVAVPHLAVGALDEGAILADLTKRAIEFVNLKGRFDAPLLWFYSPMMAQWAIGQFQERGIVYDCMDELSQFRGAPPKIVENERRLIEAADIVFTGGYELFEKKSRQHDFAHCFGCGVEYDHFAQAQEPGAIPEDLASLPKPVVGWFGVVDERVDYDLLREAAALRPDYSFVLVGPVVKVDPSKLPQAPNLHWLGGRDYADLPSYCRGFDVCMMCFAINEATEFINPTKALEYLATGKPVVSTPVKDVVRQYRDEVTIVGSVEEFVGALDALLKRPDRGAMARGVNRAKLASWDVTVSQMQALIADALEKKATTADRGTKEPVA